MNRYAIKKQPHGSQAWLNDRWQNAKGEKIVTASVAGAVHGVGFKEGAMANLAVELLAKTPPTVQEMALDDPRYRGSFLELPLMQWASKILGVEITEPKEMFCYDEPGVRMMATLDGFDGAKVYELKTIGKIWDGVLLDYWRFQGIHQAVCRDVPSIEWIVFDGRQRLQFLTQTVSSDERQHHIDAVRLFLSYIDMGMVPPDAVPTYENASDLYPDGYENTVVLDAAVLDTLWELALAKEQIKDGEKVEARIKGELGMLLGDCDYGSIDGQRVVSWKNTSRVSFDQARFKAEHPALFDKYPKVTTFRTLRVMKEKT